MQPSDRRDYTEIFQRSLSHHRSFEVNRPRSVIRMWFVEDATFRQPVLSRQPAFSTGHPWLSFCDRKWWNGLVCRALGGSNYWKDSNSRLRAGKLSLRSRRKQRIKNLSTTKWHSNISWVKTFSETLFKCFTNEIKYGKRQNYHFWVNCYFTPNNYLSTAPLEITLSFRTSVITSLWTPVSSRFSIPAAAAAHIILLQPQAYPPMSYWRQKRQSSTWQSNRRSLHMASLAINKQAAHSPHSELNLRSISS